jgi:multiple sugar transport system permease protein
MKRRGDAAILFLSPSLFGFMLFTLLPVAAAFTLSLYRWDLFHPPHFVGLTNFRRLLGWSIVDGRIVAHDSRFWKYLGNTVYFMLIIPFSMAGSLILAMMLNLKLRGRIIYRTIFFLPSVSFGVGLMLLWRYMYEPEIGLLNTLLSHFGINGPDWLGSYNWAKPAIMNMNLWATIGGTNMILYLAGLQGIPIELYEAAEVDGAGLWQRFFSVTLPMLMPTTFFILVTSIIVGLQGDFDSAYVMTQGGPDGATTTLGYYVFSHAFQWFNMGYAAAVSVILFVITLLTTMVNWRLGGGRGHYV